MKGGEKVSIFLKEKVKVGKDGRVVTVANSILAIRERELNLIEKQDWEAGHVVFLGESDGEKYYELSLHD